MGGREGGRCLFLCSSLIGDDEEETTMTRRRGRMRLREGVSECNRSWLCLSNSS